MIKTATHLKALIRNQAGGDSGMAQQAYASAGGASVDHEVLPGDKARGIGGNEAVKVLLGNAAQLPKWLRILAVSQNVPEVAACLPDYGVDRRIGGVSGVRRNQPDRREFWYTLAWVGGLTTSAGTLEPMRKQTAARIKQTIVQQQVAGRGKYYGLKSWQK